MARIDFAMSLTLLRAVCLSCCMISASEAVVISSGGANNTAPPGQPYFGNIGTVGGASGIYLGNRWVLTANHVAGSLPASTNFGGLNYSTQAGTHVQLQNPSGSGLSEFTDMVLFRLQSAPPLPSLPLTTAMPAPDAELMMIGRGRVQEPTETLWIHEVNPGPADDTWTVTTDPGTANQSGFHTTATQEIRWGLNQVNANNLTINVGGLDVRSFLTLFGTATNQAQGVIGDSGGAVLLEGAEEWELAGMMVAVSTFENQPGGTQTAVYGNGTFMVDLSFYAPQILAIIPEPASATLVVFAGLLLLRRRR